MNDVEWEYDRLDGNSGPIQTRVRAKTLEK